MLLVLRSQSIPRNVFRKWLLYSKQNIVHSLKPSSCTKFLPSSIDIPRVGGERQKKRPQLPKSHQHHQLHQINLIELQKWKWKHPDPWRNPNQLCSQNCWKKTNMPFEHILARRLRSKGLFKHRSRSPAWKAILLFLRRTFRTVVGNRQVIRHTIHERRSAVSHRIWWNLLVRIPLIDLRLNEFDLLERLSNSSTMQKSPHKRSTFVPKEKSASDHMTIAERELNRRKQTEQSKSALPKVPSTKNRVSTDSSSSTSVSIAKKKCLSKLPQASQILLILIFFKSVFIAVVDRPHHS